MTAHLRVALLHRVPPQVTPVDEWLAPILDDVVLITASGVAEAYRQRLPHVRAFDDYEHSDAVDAELRALCRDGVERVVHVTEGDVLRAARIRDEFGLPGIDFATALAYRDKYLMKQYLHKAGVPVPRFAAPADRDDLLAAAAELGYPLVSKPRTGVGSRGVQIVSTPAELLASVGGDLDQVLLEEYVPGAMIHIDGFMADGKPLCVVPSAYVNNCLSYRDSLPLGSVQLDRDSALHARVRTCTEAVIAALPPTDFSPYHLELFVREETAELVFCEIACRLGGGYIMDTLGLAVGENPAALAIRHQAGLMDGRAYGFTLDHRSHGFLLVPPRRGRLVRVDQPPPADFLTAFHVATTWPRDFSGAAASGQFVCAFVVSGTDESATRSHLSTCVEYAADCLKWEEE